VAFVRAQVFEGLVAKRRDGRYEPGQRSGSTFEIASASPNSSRLNLDEVEPGVTKLAPVRLAPKDAQDPIEYAMRWADSVGATIWA
jgi:hypothetical protein